MKIYAEVMATKKRDINGRLQRKVQKWVSMKLITLLEWAFSRYLAKLKSLLRNDSVKVGR